jgi:hypothetical protein
MQNTFVAPEHTEDINADIVRITGLKQLHNTYVAPEYADGMNADIVRITSIKQFREITVTPSFSIARHDDSPPPLMNIGRMCGISNCELCKELDTKSKSEHMFEWVLSLRDWESSINYAQNRDQMVFGWGVDYTQHRIREIHDKLGVLQTRTV